ncbi:hypothetical protein AC1031_013460 [Aphanomyces cochlioides]|nr:hypothetical protein AC1031_013460 [Aphanomyces cochlioides]
MGKRRKGRPKALQHDGRRPSSPSHGAAPSRELEDDIEPPPKMNFPSPSRTTSKEPSPSKATVEELPPKEGSMPPLSSQPEGVKEKKDNRVNVATEQHPHDDKSPAKPSTSAQAPSIDVKPSPSIPSEENTAVARRKVETKQDEAVEMVETAGKVEEDVKGALEVKKAEEREQEEAKQPELPPSEAKDEATTLTRESDKRTTDLDDRVDAMAKERPAPKTSDDEAISQDDSKEEKEDTATSKHDDSAGVAAPPRYQVDLTQFNLPTEKAHRITQHVLFGWIKASIPIRARFSQALLSPSVPLVDFCDAFSPLRDVEIAAFQVAYASPSDALSTARCPQREVYLDCLRIHDFAMAKVFAVELVEFQLRKAIRDRAAKKTRGRCDVFRCVRDLVGDQVDPITPETLLQIAVGKLGLACPAWAAQCIFCRVLAAPRAQMCPPKHFVHSLDQFVCNVHFDESVSVEGVIRELARTRDMEQSFRAMDVDGSGALSIAECTAFLHGRGVDFSKTVLEEFLQRFDRDGDGSLNLDEFLACCRPKQHFGVHVLSCFGFFYMPMDPTERMVDAVTRIHKRLFWLDHNYRVLSQASSKAKQFTVANVQFWRHFGTLRLDYKPTDSVQATLMPGELLVAVDSSKRYAVQRPPPLRPYPARLPEQDKPQNPQQPPLEDEAVVVEKKQRRTTRRIDSETTTTPTIEFKANVEEWTQVDVKKWIIYVVQAKSVAHKFAQVHGATLLEWAADPNLEQRLRDDLKIHMALQRHKLVTRIQKLVSTTKQNLSRRPPRPLKTSGDGEGHDAAGDKSDDEETRGKAHEEVVLEEDRTPPRSDVQDDRCEDCHEESEWLEDLRHQLHDDGDETMSPSGDETQLHTGDDEKSPCGDEDLPPFEDDGDETSPPFGDEDPPPFDDDGFVTTSCRAASSGRHFVPTHDDAL